MFHKVMKIGTLVEYLQMLVLLACKAALAIEAETNKEITMRVAVYYLAVGTGVTNPSLFVTEDNRNIFKPKLKDMIKKDKMYYVADIWVQ